MTNLSKKTLTAILGALAIGAGVAATASPAAAWGLPHHHHHGGWGPGLGIGLGLAMGGALAASSYRPVYSDCYFERRPVFNRFGHVVGYRRIRVC